MNYRLSCATVRPLKKNGFILELNGKEVESYIFKMQGTNIKENLLETIYRGLKTAKPVIAHNDLLVVEVQNIHLTNWLSGLTEYKGYETGLDKVFDLLEGMDCKYKFVFNKSPYAKNLVQKREVTQMSCTGLDEAFGDLE